MGELDGVVEQATLLTRLSEGSNLRLCGAKPGDNGASIVIGMGTNMSPVLLELEGGRLSPPLLSFSFPVRVCLRRVFNSN